MLKVNSAVFSGNCSNVITEEDMHNDNSEVLAMFGEFQAGVDMVELDEGHMVLDGYAVKEITQPTNPPKDFTREDFSRAESDLLNLEVTDEIEDLIYALAKEKGLVAQPLVEDVLFDDGQVPNDGIDYDRALSNAIPIFDKYFEVSLELDKAVDLTGWNAMRTRRQTWWSHFQEEMDTNWLKLTAFEAKGDRQLFLLGLKGKEPTEAQWTRFMGIRKTIMKDCLDMQNKRYEFTSGIYQKCLQVTTQAREFWKTPQGEAINKLRSIRFGLYQELNQPVLLMDGNVIKPWDLVTSYWQLREEELSPNFTSGDTSSVDDPEVVLENKSVIESLMDSHLYEEVQIENGNTYWMNWYDTWLTKRIDKCLADEVDINLANDALLESIDEMYA
jgi:hypothetical protein